MKSKAAPGSQQPAAPPGTLRAEIEARRARGAKFTLAESLHLCVPLCTNIAEHHRDGTRFFVHPACIRYSEGEGAIDLGSAKSEPTSQADHACVAPEARTTDGGDARASVFSMGAILYELVTGTQVGPGMRRPKDLVPELPTALDQILAKALVGDPQHRPADLGALAQALHKVAPSASVKPPPADESHLDHDIDFDVDLRMSYVPPEPGVPSARHISRQPSFADLTEKLSRLKASLEADPRPRYIVIKDGIDHGPFNAVELLQQIGSHAFAGEHTLRDLVSREEKPISDWDAFAPFAEQAKLHRDIAHERRALMDVVHAERTGTQTKAIVFGALLVVFLAGAGGLWVRAKARREQELAVHGDTAISVSAEGSLSAAKGAGRVNGGGTRGGGSGNYPTLGGGLSCEGAAEKYTIEYNMMSGDDTKPDLTAGAYGAVLNRGTYLNSCGVPNNMDVNICAAVQNGRAVGVTVTTRPPNGGIASCISGQIRGMSFPSHPRLDITRTTFAAN